MGLVVEERESLIGDLNLHPLALATVLKPIGHHQVDGNSDKVVFGNLEEVLAEEDVQIRIFGKPEVVGHRRLGVILASANTIEEALAKAERAYSKLQIEVLPR